MKAFTLVAALAAACLCGVAHANTVTYTSSFAGLTDVTREVIAVQQFDASLGALQSATFTLDAIMNTQLTVNNDGSFYVGWDKQTYTLSLTGDTGFSNIAIAGSAAPTRVLGTGTPNGSFNLSTYQKVMASDPRETLVAPGYYLFNAEGPTLSVSQTFSPAAINAFVGTGTLNFFLTTANFDTYAVAGTQTQGVPPSLQRVLTSVASNVSVTYTYAPVPEPTTTALMIAGLGLVGFAARGKKRV